MNFTFALNGNFLDYDINKFAKQVKTKKWVKTFKNDLYKWGDKLTTAGIDNRQVLGGMLQAAFGVNIGKQIEEKLSDDDLAKIRLNIIQIVYN